MSEKLNTCGATISFGDDYGDNSSTFHCGRRIGHSGLHRENGNMYGEQEYHLTWQGDGRRIELEFDINRYSEQLTCEHIWEPLVTPEYPEWAYCSKCGVEKGELSKVVDELSQAKAKLAALG